MEELIFIGNYWVGVTNVISSDGLVMQWGKPVDIVLVLVEAEGFEKQHVPNTVSVYNSQGKLNHDGDDAIDKAPY